MGAWSADSKTNVAHMEGDDFRSTERSTVMAGDTTLRIELVEPDGTTTVLRPSVPVLAGEVVDASVMRVAALRQFFTAQIARAKAEGVLFSVHLKATMMKVSDPIIFGHVVRAFFPRTFATYGEVLATAALVLAIFMTAAHARTRRFTPWTLPPLFAWLVWWEAPWSGASTNPARSLGPALLTGNWSGFWIYLVGPLLGAGLAVALLRLEMFGQHRVPVARLFHFS